MIFGLGIPIFDISTVAEKSCEVGKCRFESTVELTKTRVPKEDKKKINVLQKFNASQKN